MGVLEKGMWPALIVALITWGGVVIYLVRLDILTRRLEDRLDEVAAREATRAAADGYGN